MSGRRPLWRIIPLLLLCALAPAGGTGIPDPNDPGPTDVLLNSWGFADTTNWVSDRGYSPVSFTNLSGSDLGDGAALVVDSTEPAWLRYNVVENDGTTNLTVDTGSLTVWYAPTSWASTNAGGTGPGDWGRLIEVGSYTEDASFGWWSVYVDPAGSHLYFSAQADDGSQTNYLSAPIAWTTNRWHFIALTYSTATNCALYIDGEWVTNGPPMTVWPGADALSDGFTVGSSSNGIARARGMIDQLATYANPLDAGTIAATYGWWYLVYYLNPMNFANIAPAPSTPQASPTFMAITGAGYLTDLGTVATCVQSTNVWITNVVATLSTNAAPSSNWVNVTFAIWGGSNALPYDVFATAGLVGQSITNAQWAWLGQGYSCTRYMLTNLPASSALLILGTPLDRDGDGLTDAFERLVSYTNPQRADTSGDGIPDGWKYLWGMDLQMNYIAQPAQRANYSYDPVGWLEGVTGLRSEAVGPDPEGNVLSAGQ